MRAKLFVGLALAAAALAAAGGAWAAEENVPFQSGLHPGDRLASFLCRGINGPNKGKPLCYVWMAADRPVALVFARNAPGALSMLLKRLDEAVDRHKAVELRAIAVFLTEDRPATEAKLEKLVQEAKLSDNVPLVIPENPTAVKPYKIHKDAEVTVVLYSNFKVLGNFAFKAGEMQEKDVAAIMAQVPRILPTKEEWDRQVKAKKEAMERWEKEQLKKKEELKKQEELKKKDELKKKTEAAAKEKA